MSLAAASIPRVVARALALQAASQKAGSEHVRRLFADIRSSCRDTDRALIALLALEGLCTHDLFEHTR